MNQLSNFVFVESERGRGRGRGKEGKGEEEKEEGGLIDVRVAARTVDLRLMNIVMPACLPVCLLVLKA